MPVHESEAIILQSYPLGEADRIVSFFSRGAGRLRGVAKGARRTKSRFGSTLERLSHIRIWYYERETRDLVRINQSELIESFMQAHADYDTSVAFSLFSEISEMVLPEREPLDAPFRLLLLVSKAIKKSVKPAVPLAYFCLWTLKLAGWLPSLDHCGICGRNIAGEAGFVSPSLEAVACSKCKPASARMIPKETLTLAQRMLFDKLDQLMQANLPPLAVHELTAHLLDWIEWHGEKHLKSRELWEPTN